MIQVDTKLMYVDYFITIINAKDLNWSEWSFRHDSHYIVPIIIYYKPDQLLICVIIHDDFIGPNMIWLRFICER